jgi:hypothetical protein
MSWEEQSPKAYGALQPLLERAEGLKGSWRMRQARPLVGSDQRVQLSLNHVLQLPHNAQIRVNVSGFLPVPDLLTVQVHFEPAVRARSQGDPDVTTEGPEEFVGHPRGRGVMLSRNAVQDIHENFPLAICGHVYPPYNQVASLQRPTVSD